LVQVCETLSPENRARETEGLLEAMNTYRLPEGILLTRGRVETISLPESGHIIQVINIIDWLL
ncbi:MAG: ATP-binding protein, partial [Bacteroidia bacterium]|nr:ATP-binding protein [Bacteroidia bacterium]